MCHLLGCRRHLLKWHTALVAIKLHRFIGMHGIYGRKCEFLFTIFTESMKTATISMIKCYTDNIQYSHEMNGTLFSSMLEINSWREMQMIADNATSAPIATDCNRENAKERNIQCMRFRATFEQQLNQFWSLFADCIKHAKVCTKHTNCYFSLHSFLLSVFLCCIHSTHIMW